MTEHELDEWYADNDYHKLGVSKKQLDNLRAWQRGAHEAKRKKIGKMPQKGKDDFSERGQQDFDFDEENDGDQGR